MVVWLSVCVDLTDIARTNDLSEPKPHRVCAHGDNGNLSTNLQPATSNLEHTTHDATVAARVARSRNVFTRKTTHAHTHTTLMNILV